MPQKLKEFTKIKNDYNYNHFKLLYKKKNKK